MTTLASWMNHQTAMGPVWAVLLTLVGLPLANEVVQRFRGTRAESLLQALAFAVLKLPVLGNVIAKFPIVGDILYVFAPANKQGIPTPLIAKPTAVLIPADVIDAASAPVGPPPTDDSSITKTQAVTVPK